MLILLHRLKSSCADTKSLTLRTLLLQFITHFHYKHHPTKNFRIRPKIGKLLLKRFFQGLNDYSKRKRLLQNHNSRVINLFS